MKKLTAALALLLALTCALLPARPARADLREDLDRLLTDLGADASVLLEDAGAALDEHLRGFTDEAGRWLADSADRLQGLAEAFGDWAETELPGVWNDLQGAAGELRDSLADGFADLSEQLAPVFGSAADLAKEGAEALKPYFEFFYQNYVRAFIAEVERLFTGDAPALDGEGQAALDALREYAAGDRPLTDAELTEYQQRVLEALEGQGADVPAFLSGVERAGGALAGQRLSGIMAALADEYAQDLNLEIPAELAADLETLRRWSAGEEDFSPERFAAIESALARWLEANGVSAETWREALLQRLAEQ